MRMNRVRVAGLSLCGVSLVLMTILVLQACDKPAATTVLGPPSNSPEGRAEDAETDESLKKSKINSGEDNIGSEKTLTPPASIDLAYLICALEKTASASDGKMRLACALNRETDKLKADTVDYVGQARFDLKVDPGITVTQKDISVDPQWHVLFFISATDPALLNKVLETGKLSLSGRDLKSARPAELVANLSQILLSPLPGLDMSTGNYTPSITAAFQGPLLATVPQLPCASITPSDKGIHLGRFNEKIGKCAFAYGVAVQESPNYVFIAAATGGTWLNGANKSIPATAIPLGKEGSGTPQFLCRATVANQGQILGKIATGFDGCNMATTTGYLQVNTYQVLSK